jgi:hypothetical protein
MADRSQNDGNDAQQTSAVNLPPTLSRSSGLHALVFGFIVQSQAKEGLAAIAQARV